MKRFARWLWLKLTGDDPVIVRGHFDSLSALNECHCRFLEKLAVEHPELQAIIEEHQIERFQVLHKDIEIGLVTEIGLVVESLKKLVGFADCWRDTLGYPQEYVKLLIKDYQQENEENKQKNI